LRIAAALIVLALVVAVAAWLGLRQLAPQMDLTDSMAYLLDWKDRTTVQTRLGKIRGIGNGRVSAFLGVPYAQPATGDRRFMPPVAVEPWEGILDATSYPSIAWQSPDSLLDDRDVSQMSEDSLFLNLFTPTSEGAGRPVLLWIHGGGFTEGSANGYNGSILAEQGDVVVVAINYRLGIFGFLDLSAYGPDFAGSASNGIRDQIQALIWVRDNIADYGGDPGNVTIFGESAGGGSVQALMSSPSADGLYHKAIVQSAGLVNQPPPDQRQVIADHLEVELNDVPETLRALPPEDLIDLHEELSLSFEATIDGTVITRSSNEAILDRGANGVPVIAGYNRDEGALFSYIIPWFIKERFRLGVAALMFPEADPEHYLAQLKLAYPEDSDKEHFERVWNDLMIRGATETAVRASAAGPGGWVYRFDMPVQRGVSEDLGAVHGAEIAFTFNTFAGDAPETAFLYHKNDPEVRQLALDWSNTIIQFARTGDPNGAGLPPWPRYTADSRQTMILDAQPRTEPFLYTADRARWGDTETSSSDFYP
jgi:para-nitrobenzyl esterase